MLFEGSMYISHDKINHVSKIYNQCKIFTATQIYKTNTKIFILGGWQAKQIKHQYLEIPQFCILIKRLNSVPEESDPKLQRWHS
jgi:hypothetical protein